MWGGERVFERAVEIGTEDDEEGEGNDDLEHAEEGAEDYAWETAAAGHPVFRGFRDHCRVFVD